jgi:uncharacterized protein YkwD
VRSGGDIGASIVATASAGTTIQLLDHKGGWYRVKLADGKIGWSADWLVQTIAEDAVDTTSAASTVGSVHDVIHETVSTQGGVIPDGVDLVQLNEYGLQKINALRADRNLRQLVLDQRWVTTAAEYAAYMGKTGATNHERADGSSMHQWVDAKGMPFTERYSAGGWKTNYFTENIAWGYTDGSTEGVERVLDNTLEFFLGEASYNGAHYRTIYHPDWNSIGLGFYFAPQGGGQYKVFVVMHYGSLVL